MARKERRYHRTGHLRFLLGLALAVSVCALMLIFHGLNDRVFPADAAIVFGDEVLADGNISPRLQARLDLAFGLYYYGTVKNIVASGGAGKSGLDTAETTRDYLCNLGVAPENIIIDPNGSDIRATARFTAAYAREHGWTSVIAVNQFFFLPRSVLSLKHEGVPAVGSLSVRDFGADDIYFLLREIPAYFAYWSEIK